MNHSKEDWINGASAQLKVDPKTVKEAIQSGNLQQLTAAMRQEDKDKVQSLLNDPSKMKEMLNSPTGKALLKLFGNKA